MCIVLQALPLLQKQFPIERARMQLKLVAPGDRKQELYDLVDSHQAVIESCDNNPQTSSVVVQVEPGLFRELHAAVQVRHLHP